MIARTKEEKVEELIRGMLVKPTILDSSPFHKNEFETFKKAMDYLKNEGFDTYVVDELIKEVERLNSTRIIIKSDKKTKKELLDLTAREVNNIYKRFLEDCKFVEKALDEAISVNLKKIFDAFSRYAVDYRKIADPNVRSLFKPYNIEYIEAKVEKYGKLWLVWRSTISGRFLYNDDFKPTEEEKEFMKDGWDFMLKHHTLGEGFYCIFTAPNANLPDFIINEDVVNAIKYGEIKELKPYKYYNHWDYGKKIGRYLNLIP